MFCFAKLHRKIVLGDTGNTPSPERHTISHIDVYTHPLCVYIYVCHFSIVYTLLTYIVNVNTLCVGDMTIHVEGCDYSIIHTSPYSTYSKCKCMNMSLHVCDYICDRYLLHIQIEYLKIGGHLRVFTGLTR